MREFGEGAPQTMRDAARETELQVIGDDNVAYGFGRDLVLLLKGAQDEFAAFIHGAKDMPFCETGSVGPAINRMLGKTQQKDEKSPGIFANLLIWLVFADNRISRFWPS